MILIHIWYNLGVGTGFAIILLYGIYTFLFTFLHFHL
jgi:hypothetical protein